MIDKPRQDKDKDKDKSKDKRHDTRDKVIDKPSQAKTIKDETMQEQNTTKTKTDMTHLHYGSRIFLPWFTFLKVS